MIEREQATSDIEVIQPLGQAWEHMKSALFPFRFATWITLGFVTFLVQITFGTLRLPKMPKFSGEPVPPTFIQIARWLDSHDSMIVIATAIGLALALVLSVIFAYLSSRATFVYLDDIYRRKAEIVNPWHKTRNLAHSFFAWRLCLAIIMTLFLGGAAIFFFVSYRSNLYDTPNLELMLKMLAPLAIMAPLFLLIALAAWTLHSLIAPLMYMRNCPCSAAWPILGNMFQRRPGAFILYFLMNVCLGLLLIPLVIIVTIVTCCIGLLPVINQAVLQPFHYWIGAYPFFFFAQFGQEFAAPPAEEFNEPETVHGLPPSMPREQAAQRVEACPHCGQQHAIPEGQPGTYACVRCGREFTVR